MLQVYYNETVLLDHAPWYLIKTATEEYFLIHDCDGTGLMEITTPLDYSTHYINGVGVNGCVAMPPDGLLMLWKLLVA